MTMTLDDFHRVDIRVGTAVSASPFPDAAGAVVPAGPGAPVPDGGRLF